METNICAVEDCGCRPNTAVLTFGGPTIDERLYFCQDAFDRLCPLYKAYKTMEIDLNLCHICYFPNGKYPQRDDPVPVYLIECYQNVTKIIALRTRFQSLLRTDIVSIGHEHWMQRLKDYQRSLRNSIDAYFELWEVPKHSQGHKPMAHFSFFHDE